MSSSLEAKKEFKDYNSCYEIISPADFFNEITIFINRITPVRFKGYTKVIYKDRDELYNKNGNDTSPALIKEPIFKEQYEIRAIWEPLTSNTKIKPLNIASYKLGKWMRPINL